MNLGTKNNNINHELENLILRYNFILSNIYFLFNNLNYGFYLSFIEKVGENIDRENEKNLNLLKDCFKILNISEILKKDFDFLEEECERIVDILYEIRYDLENIKENSKDLHQKQIKKVEESINDLDKTLDIIKNNLDIVGEIKKINPDDLFTGRGIKKFSILLLDLRRRTSDLV